MWYNFYGMIGVSSILSFAINYLKVAFIFDKGFFTAETNFNEENIFLWSKK